MLARSIARVDDWHRAHGGGAPGRALFVVPEHDDVGVTTDDSNGVLECLALGRRRELARVVGADRVTTQAEHRRLERKTGACRWFVEQRGHHLPVETAGEMMGLTLYLFCAIEKLLEQRSGELLALDHMLKATSDGHEKTSFPTSRGSDLKEPDGESVRRSLSATVSKVNKRPGSVVVTTEVGFCSFCGRPRNLRSEAHQLGTLVRTIVTCETCHRTLSSSIGVASAEPEPGAAAQEPEPPAPAAAAVAPAAPKVKPAPKAKPAAKTAPKRAAATTKSTASKKSSPKKRS